MNEMKISKTFMLFLFGIFLVLSAGACNGGNGEQDADADIETTGDTDADVEIRPDVRPDQDVTPDPDGVTDPDGEIQEDADAVDAEAEVPEDVPADGDGAGCNSIAEVRAAADGDVDLMLCNVTVTYVAYSGYFVQDAQTGPAIQIYEGGTWTPDVTVGDEISMHVTRLTTFHGSKEVNLHDAVIVHSSGNDVSLLEQDLSAGTPPSEDLEAELVRVIHATVTSISGQDLLISYGTAADVAMRVEDSSILCVGATFSVLAVVTEWSDDSIHRIQSFANTDFYEIDTSGCGGGGRAPVPGDLLMNEFMASVPAGMAGDANCDGTRNSDDEFIEIVNITADILDLTGVTIADSVTVRHTFSPGTSLDPGKVFVVFGGGTPSCTWASDVQVAVASGGSLGLNDGGDTITIADSSAVTLIAHTYTGAANNQSYTLNPDLNDTDPSPTGVGGFVNHSTADTIDGSLFSPGTRIDGTAF
jgi:hypothetical protein